MSGRPNRDVEYKENLDEYIENIFVSSNKYPLLYEIVKLKEKDIRKIDSYDKLAENELLMFLAMGLSRVARLEESLGKAASIRGYDSIQKRLKEKVLKRVFWDTIAEIQAASYLAEIPEAQELEFPRSGNEGYDIKYSLGSTIGYISVKNWEEVDLPFSAIRKEIIKRSLYDAQYRNKYWSIGIDFVEPSTSLYPCNFKAFTLCVRSSISTFFDQLELSANFANYQSEDDLLKIVVETNYLSDELPLIGYGFATARELSNSEHFFHFGKMYSRFLGACHHEYSELKKICSNQEELAASRLIIYPNLGLTGFPYSEEIESGINNLKNLFHLDEIMKVDVLR